MRFREILRFEVRHQLRRPPVWLYLVLLLGLCAIRAVAMGPGVVQYHAPSEVAFSSITIGVLGTLVTAGLFVEAGYRDLRWRVEPLLFATPLRRWEYLGGRFFGVLLVNAILLLSVPAGLVVMPWLLGISPEILGPLRLEAYGAAYLVFLLPNLLLNAAVLYGITVLSRRSLPGYIGLVGLTAVYLFAGLTGGSDSLWLAALLDPTGATAATVLTDSWNHTDLNTRLIKPTGLLLWNRLVWTAVGGGMLVFAYRRFHRAHDEPRRRRGLSTMNIPSPEKGAYVRHAMVAAPVNRSFLLRTRMRQMLAVLQFELRQTVFSNQFLLITIGLVACALLILLDAPMAGVPLWPLTQEVTAELADLPMKILIALLTAFYAGELVWRERDAGIDKISDAAPVPNWVPFGGKLLTLGFLLALLQTMLMAAGMLVQVLQNYYAIEFDLYVKVLFGLQLPEYLQFAVLALLIHVVVNQKYVGHLAAALMLVAILQAERLGIEHNLLVYGSDAGWVYSDLNGLGPFLEPFVWFKLYWTCWAVLFSIAAMLLWVRGIEEDGLRTRWQVIKHRFSRRTVASAGVAGVAVAVTGGFVFYNTNVVNDYRTQFEREEIFAEYERRYKRFSPTEQPQLSRMQLDAELFPDRREATLRATYHLVNRTQASIDSVHLFSLPNTDATLHNVVFEKPAVSVLEDAAHGYRIYALERALQPGDSMLMHFELQVARQGFRNSEMASPNSVLVGDFTNLGSWLLPAVGYQREHELSSVRTRRAHNLPTTDIRPSVHDARARHKPRIPWIHLEGTVATAGDQIAVLPGTLLREWTDGDRRFFHYRTDAPILNFFALNSGKYAVHEAAWNDIDIRLLHHPAHDFNLEHIVRSVHASMNYYTAQFGAYPHSQLWLIEFPRYRRFARAYGGQFVYSENTSISLARMADGDSARLYWPLQIIAHEVAHQWWGQQVMGADVQGTQVLSEALAQYSSAMVVERTQSLSNVRSLLHDMHRNYVTSRGRNEAPEVPLLLATRHAYIYYNKGPVVLYALQNYIGENGLNAALRRLVEKHAYHGPPYPTTLDLRHEIRAATPDSLQYLLTDFFEEITFWDLQLTRAHAVSTGAGEYLVTLDVEAHKVRADSIGNEQKVPMDDFVEVGVFSEDGEPIHLQKHYIRSGQQTITVLVPETPARAGIDPNHLLIDLDIGDNIDEVKIES